MKTHNNYCAKAWQAFDNIFIQHNIFYFKTWQILIQQHHKIICFRMVILKYSLSDFFVCVRTKAFVCFYVAGNDSSLGDLPG